MKVTESPKEAFLNAEVTTIKNNKKIEIQHNNATQEDRNVLSKVR